MAHPHQILMRKGYVIIITGDGKGKTTSAIGTAFRAAGWGLKTYIAQFMKGCETGEIKAAAKFPENIKIELFGSPSFVKPGKPDERDVELAKLGLRKAKDAMLSGDYDIVILDEVNVALKMGLLSLEEVMDLIRGKPERVDLVLTGRYAPPELIDMADLVSEVREVKHYFRKGVRARKGIEY